MPIFISAHAHTRLERRSKLHHNDLRKQIEAEAYVTLGSNARAKFVLVYSPADSKYLIILLSQNGLTIISVWKGSYALPHDIPAVNTEHMHAAKQRYYDFLFTEFLNVPNTFPLRLTLLIENATERHLLSLGSDHTLQNPQDRRAALDYLQPHLSPIVVAVTAHPAVVPVWYTALFHTVEDTLIAKHTWRHNQGLRRFLKQRE